ncbi:hypothetical protein GQ43DRAFT_496428 [Delitschia confertaspora ATCC 74209]|uniref:Tetraspanin family protein n=1 Tax=Delitschia confertaspora ATCC 74209 TaxID=1513339 RepID=A0A9P4JIV9_9PLEO|nr:hypothetical protein GQ43DRAFT_496428 [Delitschia confertaspora ATCC 74209]
MPYTRKQVVTCTSIVYLIAVTALAGYATSRSNKLSIPISSTLSGLTTLLPILSGLFLEAGYDITRLNEKRRHVPQDQIQRPPLVIVANTLIFIYSTVVITLLGTHAAPPPGLNCSLQERWTTLFRQKDAEAIRTIQDAFQCCGLMNAHDRAWPFPDKTHDARACERQLERSKGCFGPWRAEEQRVAGMLMMAVGLVFLWQLTIIIAPTKPSSWLSHVVPTRVSRLLADVEQGKTNGRNSRRAIDYHYQDNVVAEANSDSDEESIPSGRIEGPQTNGLSNGLIEGVEVEGHHPQVGVENEWSRPS